MRIALLTILILFTGALAAVNHVASTDLSKITRTQASMGPNGSPQLSSTNVTTSDDGTAFESSYLSNSFFAQGLIWLFYEDTTYNCEHQSGCLFYTTSANGASWSTPSRVNNNVGKPVHETDSDFSAYSNGTYVFYARYNESSFESDCNRGLFAREGKLSPTGSVAWGTEQIAMAADAQLTYNSPFISMDTTGQLWIGFMNNSATSCGGTGTDTPVVTHTIGTDYAQWTSTTTLTTETSDNWHVALAQLPGGQMYATFWIAAYSLHGELYAGNAWGAEESISNAAGQVDGTTGNCTGGVCLDINTWLFANGSTLYSLYFDNSTKDYYVATRSNGAWNTPGNIAAIGDTYTGMDCCGPGNVYFNSQWYSLPDSASYNTNGTFYLYYMLSSGQVDMWKGGPAGGWTKTTGIVTSSTAPYPDSITSFITSSPTGAFPTIGGAFFITGTSSPFLYHFAETVRPQDFQIGASTPYATNIGTTSNSTITITAINGLVGTVNLSDVTPMNLACNLPPNVVMPPSPATALLTCNSQFVGNYTVNVMATSGSLTHSTNANFTIVENGPQGGSIVTIDRLALLTPYLVTSISLAVLITILATHTRAGKPRRNVQGRRIRSIWRTLLKATHHHGPDLLI